MTHTNKEEAKMYIFTHAWRRYLIQIPETWAPIEVVRFQNWMLANVRISGGRYTLGEVVCRPGEALPEGFEKAFVLQKEDEL